MTDDNKFFRWVWRFNALVVAVAGLGVLALVGFSFAATLMRPPYDKPAGGFTPVPPAAEQNATYRIEESSYGIGGITLVSGGVRERMLALRRWEGAPSSFGLANAIVERTSQSYVGREAVNAVNLLILNVETGDSHWMFAGYHRAIVTGEPVYPVDPYITEASQAPSIPPGFMVLLVRDSDDNHDGKLDDKDRISLYAYRAGTPAPIKFLTADLIISTRQIGADKYMVVFEQGKSAFAAIYALDGFKLLSKKPLPKLQG